MDGQDCGFSVTNDVFGHAPQQCPFESSPAVCPHDDQVDIVVCSIFEDEFMRIPLVNRRFRFDIVLGCPSRDFLRCLAAYALEPTYEVIDPGETVTDADRRWKFNYEENVERGIVCSGDIESGLDCRPDCVAPVGREENSVKHTLLQGNCLLANGKEIGFLAATTRSVYSSTFRSGFIGGIWVKGERRASTNRPVLRKGFRNFARRDIDFRAYIQSDRLNGDNQQDRYRHGSECPYRRESSDSCHERRHLRHRMLQR